MLPARIRGDEDSVLRLLLEVKRTATEKEIHPGTHIRFQKLDASLLLRRRLLSLNWQHQLSVEE